MGKVIGKQGNTINAIREKSHWNSQQLTPRDPVGLGLCMSADLEKAVVVARGRAARAGTPVVQNTEDSAETGLDGTSEND